MSRTLPGMRLTIPHYFDFGVDRARIGSQLVHRSSWDAARETAGPFGLPETRAEWEARATAEDRARARAIAGVARELGARRLASYGVGTAVLELQLAREAPELDLVCSDFAPRSVERLRALFPEAIVVEHDLLLDDPVDADLHLLHRVDTEFSNRDLARVLARFHQPVLLVPAELLDWGLVASEIVRRLRHPRATRAGWLRSEGTFRGLWGRAFQAREVAMGSARGFLLVPAGGGF